MSKRFELNRRRFVAAGLVLAATPKLRPSASEVCKLTPEQETGPYYVADELLRPDIVEGKPGVPLHLRIVIVDTRTCQPMPNAAVDVWHCDALGLYSGFTRQSLMGPSGPPPGGPRPDGPPPDGRLPGEMGPRIGPPPMNPTDKLTFLRGIQITGPDGAVAFQTVFPGVYRGRTNHVHFKVRLGGDPARKTYQGGHTSHTGQIFFPEELAVQLMRGEPYLQHKIHRTTQAEDDVFNGQHGDVSLARVALVHPQDPAAGLHAELIAMVDPTATPSPAQRRNQRPPAHGRKES